MKTKRRVVIALAVLIIIGAGTYMLLNRGKKVVWVFGLPKSTVVNGTKVTIISAERDLRNNSKVVVTMDYEFTDNSGPGFTFLDFMSVVLNGKHETGTMESEEDTPTKTRMALAYHIPSDAKRISMSQPLQLRGKSTKFEFKSFTPSSLPLTQTMGNARVTLISLRPALIKQPKDTKWTQIEGYVKPKRAYLCAIVEGDYPAGYNRRLTEYGLKVDLLDDKDKKCKLVAIYSDHAPEVSGEDATYNPRPGDPTLQQSPVHVRDYCYFEIPRTASKRFSLLTFGRLPVKPGAVLLLTFKNVPIN